MPDSFFCQSNTLKTEPRLQFAVSTSWIWNLVFQQTRAASKTPVRGIKNHVFPDQHPKSGTAFFICVFNTLDLELDVPHSGFNTPLASHPSNCSNY